MTTATLLRYEWDFLSPKQTFDFLLQVSGPVVERSFVYVVEAVGADGSVNPDIGFNWFFSQSMERSFLYTGPVAEPSVQALRSLRADRPIRGIRLTVRPWDGSGQIHTHGECWVRTTAAGSHAESGVWALTKGRRAVEESTG